MRALLISRFLLCLLGSVAVGCGSKVLKNAEQLLELGQCDQAHQILEKFVQEDPQNSDAFVLLGDARFCRAEKGSERALLRLAQEAYESAHKLEPNSRSAILHLGIVQLVQGNIQESLEILRTGLKHNPKDTALREYLGIALWQARHQDPAASEEVRTLVQTLDSGKGWQQLPAYQLRDKRASGTFIVTRGKAQLKCISGESCGELTRWFVAPFFATESDTVKFTDKTQTYMEMRIAYMYPFAFAQECVQKGEMAQHNAEVTTGPRGSVIGRIGRQIQWAKCLQERVHTANWYYEKVEYPWPVFRDKFVKKADVVLGVGEETVDQIRAGVLAAVGAKLNPDLVTHLLNGELRPGLPYMLINAVLGQTQPPLIFTGGVLSPKKVRSLVKVGDFELIYEDGLLASWKGEWRSGAEDQDYDSQ